MSEDVRTPIYFWAVAPLLGWLDEPLLAGRLVSAGAGILAVAIVYRIGRTLFDPWLGAGADWIMAVMPAGVFHDRLALIEATGGPAIVPTNHFPGAPRDLVTLEFRHAPNVRAFTEVRLRHPAPGVAATWRVHGVRVYAIANGGEDLTDGFARTNPEFVQLAEFARPGGRTSVVIFGLRNS